MIELRWLRVTTPFEHPQNATVTNVLGQNMVLQFRHPGYVTKPVFENGALIRAESAFNHTEWQDVPVWEEE